MVFAISILGALRASRGIALAPTPQSVLTLYVSALAFQWVSFAYVWFGLHRNRVPLREVIGGRWKTPIAVCRDALIATVFWGVWIAINGLLKILLQKGSVGSGQYLYPHTLSEKLVWVAVSVSAGFCEEFAFRGYLQTQFRALTGSVLPAILLQAAVFAFGHGYQGLKLITTIFVYGIMLGLLAWWQRDLRSCMLAHAWTDVINIFRFGQSL